MQRLQQGGNLWVVSSELDGQRALASSGAHDIRVDDVGLPRQHPVTEAQPLQPCGRQNDGVVIPTVLREEILI